MGKRLIYWLLLALSGAAARAQSASQESPFPQTLIGEIRQLRADLQITAATIQRVQIVMYRLQVQGGVVDRATQRVDSAHTECGQIEDRRQMFTAQLEGFEADRRAGNALEAKEVEERMAGVKKALEGLGTAEMQCQAEQSAAENQLRTEQAKMNDLDEQLNKLDKILASAGAK